MDDPNSIVSPENIKPVTYAWVVALSVWGGVAGWVHKLGEGHARPFNVVELVGEVVISGFAGVLTYYLCAAAGIEGVASAVFVGVSGHMGSRAIFAIERWATKRFGGFE